MLRLFASSYDADLLFRPLIELLLEKDLDQRGCIDLIAVVMNPLSGIAHMQDGVFLLALITLILEWSAQVRSHPTLYNRKMLRG